MNFDVGEINLIIAALRYAGLSYQDMSAENSKLIGKRQEAQNQADFAQGVFVLANRIEREARAAGVKIHMTGH